MSIVNFLSEIRSCHELSFLRFTELGIAPVQAEAAISRLFQFATIPWPTIGYQPCLG